MSQGPLAVPNSDGATFRANMNAGLLRLATRASGTSRPADIQTFEEWIETDNPGAGVVSVWRWDGTSDVLEALFDTTTHAIIQYTKTLAPGTNSTAAASAAYADAAAAAAGGFRQFVSAQSGSVASGSTAIPRDDTIPQQTEGDQYLSLAITPQNAASRLIIDVTFCCTLASADNFAVALFRDAGAGAIKTAFGRTESTVGTQTITFRAIVAAGSTAATTFNVRAGANGSTAITFNGLGGGRLYGGVAVSGISIAEVA